MLFSYHLLYFCTALSLIIMLSSHYHHHKSKTFSQLTQCPFTGTLLLLWSGASVIRWTSGHHLWKPQLTSFCTCSRTGSCSWAPLIATDQPLLTSWATPQLMSAKKRISPVSWIVSIETDPRAGGASPPGTSPWFYTSWQRLPLNP